MSTDEWSNRMGDPIPTMLCLYQRVAENHLLHHVFLFPGRTQSAPKRCNISLVCRVVHLLPLSFLYIKKTSFLSNWPISLFQLWLPVHRWDHGCVHYRNMLWRADCKIGGVCECVCMWEGGLGGRVNGNAAVTNDN